LSEEKNLRDLLLLAEKDPAFRMKLLSNPEATAKEFKVSLKPEHVDRIKKTAAFIEALNDIRLLPGPIFYPIDGVLQGWKLKEIADIVLDKGIIGKIDWIKYPIGPIIGSRMKELQRG
jgi:hypothetical protein